MKIIFVLLLLVAGCAAQAPAPAVVSPGQFNQVSAQGLVGAVRAHQRLLEDLVELRAVNRLHEIHFKELQALMDLSGDAMHHARNAVVDGDTSRFEHSMKLSDFILNQVRQLLNSYEAAARKMQDEAAQAKPKSKPKPKPKPQ